MIKQQYTANTVLVGLLALVLYGASSLIAAQQVISPANPMQAEDTVVVSGEGIALFERGEQLPRWQVLSGQQTYEPLLAGDTVLLGSSNGLYALNRLDGAVRWHRQVSSSAIFSPLIVGKYAIAGGTDGILRAVNVDDGTTLWQRKFPGWIYSPALVGELLVSGGNQGILWALDRAGEPVWEFTLNGDELVYRPVSIGDNLVAVSTFSGRVVVLDAMGQVYWQIKLPTPVKRIDLQGEQLLLHRFGGVVTQVDTATGRLIAHHKLGGGLTYRARWFDQRWWISDDQGRISTLTRGGEITPRASLIQSVVAMPVVVGKNLLLPVKKGSELKLMPLRPAI